MINFDSSEIKPYYPSFPSLTAAAAGMLKILKNPISQWMELPVKIKNWGKLFPLVIKIIGSLVRG